MKSKLLTLAVSLASALSFAQIAEASVLYVNNAGTPYVESFDTTTGAKIFSFTAGSANGRGVVTVGDVVYTSNANNGFIGKYDRTTGTSLGGFNVAGAGGISTISYDGDNFWTSDYTGSNKAYYVSPTGTVLKTISLSKSVGYYDGLEYFDGKLIANRFDGGYAYAGGNQYSVYDTDGNLLTENFINTNGHGNGTGIAYDGTNFYIADIFNNRATIWSGVDGSYIGALTLVGLKGNAVEDLSFDFEGRDDTCRVNCNGGEVSEPAAVILLGLGIMGLALRRRRQG